MPQTFFYSFLQSIIGFFQWLFALVARLLAPIFSLSPLPDALDLILICLIIVGIVFAVFQSVPWDK